MISADATGVRCFGTLVSSDVPLDLAFEPGRPELTISSCELDRPAESPSLTFWLGNPDGGGMYALWRQAGRLHLLIEPVAQFEIGRDRIAYRRLPQATDAALRWQIFGGVLGLWLERRNHLVLHGATLECDGHAIALLGQSGAGKSTMTLALLQDGFRVVGDDHVILEPRGTVAPSLSYMKVTPDVASNLGLPADQLRPLHPAIRKQKYELPPSGRSPGGVPLRRVYLLDRSGSATTPIQFAPLDPARSVEALLRHSFAPRSVQAIGLAPNRLRRLAELAARVDVWIVTYPSSLSRLSEVARRIRKHLLGAGTEARQVFA